MKTRTLVDHAAAAARMRRRPLAWVLVCTPKDKSAAQSQVRHITIGALKPYRDGGYEAKHDRGPDGAPRVWARWIGGTR